MATAVVWSADHPIPRTVVWAAAAAAAAHHYLHLIGVSR